MTTLQIIVIVLAISNAYQYWLRWEDKRAHDLEHYETNHNIAVLHQMMYKDFVRKPLQADSFFPIYIAQVKGEG